MAAVGTGRGKLLLFGEHAAVYGHPAVGLTLRQRTTVRWKPDGRSGWRLSPSPDREILEALLLRFGEMAPGLAGREGGILEVCSSIPREVGFGSSAALCVALADLFHRLQRGLPEADSPAERLETVWRWAHTAEGLFHGTPSGVDTGLSVLNGLCSFVPRPPDLPEWKTLAGFPFFLVVGSTARRGNTGELVSALGRRVRGGDRKALSRLELLGSVAREAIDVLEGAGGAEELGELARRAQSALRLLDLSTPELDGMLVEAEQAGSLGGKLSGAGGGGAFFLIAPDRKTAAAVKRRVAEVLAVPRSAVRVVSWENDRIAADR